MSRVRDVRLFLARWIFLLGGLILPVVGFVQVQRGNQSEGSEMIAMGVVFLLVGSIWTWLHRRRRSSESVTTSEKQASVAEQASVVEQSGGATDRGPTQEEGSPEDFIASIPNHARMHIETCGNVFGITLDYNVEAFGQLDEIIDKGWGGEPPAMMDTTVVAFGSFVGEAIRHLHGGEWAFSENEGCHLRGVGGSVTVFPFSRVRKRFTQGADESIGYYYGVMRHLLEEEGKKQNGE